MATSYPDLNMKLIHYGELNNGVLLPPVVTGALNMGTKPHGTNIVWTSPLDSVWGWDKQLNRFPTQVQERWVSYGQPWVLELSPSTSFAKVDSVDDLERFISQFPLVFEDLKLFDWRLLARHFDAFWLTLEGLRANRRFFDLWECETVVLFKETAVVALTRDTS